MTEDSKIAEKNSKEETNGIKEVVIEDNTFKVKKIESIEDWTDAEDISGKFNMDINGLKITFNYKGISHLIWNSMVSEFKIPTAEDVSEDMTDEEFAILVSDAYLPRKVVLFERGLSLKIPGETIDEKCKSLSRTPYAENERLLGEIKKYCLCFDNGSDVDKEIYRRTRNTSCKGLEIKSYEDFFSATERINPYFVIFKHEAEDFLYELELKPLTEERRVEIEKEFATPKAPVRPKRTLSGGLDTTIRERFETEPNHMRRVAKIKSLKTAAYICECLPFEVPGETMEDKMKELYKKPAGDIVELSLYIMQNFVSYSDTVDFF